MRKRLLDCATLVFDDGADAVLSSVGEEAMGPAGLAFDNVAEAGFLRVRGNVEGCSPELKSRVEAIAVSLSAWGTSMLDDEGIVSTLSCGKVATPDVFFPGDCHPGLLNSASKSEVSRSVNRVQNSCSCNVRTSLPLTSPRVAVSSDRSWVLLLGGVREVCWGARVVALPTLLCMSDVDFTVAGTVSLGPPVVTAVFALFDASEAASGSQRSSLPSLFMCSNISRVSSFSFCLLSRASTLSFFILSRASTRPAGSAMVLDDVGIMRCVAKPKLESGMAGVVGVAKRNLSGCCKMCGGWRSRS